MDITARMHRTALFSAALLAASLLGACGTLGEPYRGDRDRDGGYDSGRYDDRNDLGSDLRGTVRRVNTIDRYIVVDAENDGTYRNDLRNGNEDETFLYYDDGTTVEYQDRSFRPQDLENGDRIAAEVDRVGGRLMAQQIDVLYDVSSGTGDYRDDDRYGNDDRYGDSSDARDLRGTVRSNDAQARILEVERTGYSSSFSTRRGSDPDYGSDVVQVRYDASTVVEYQGRTYAPEGLERGDLVRIDLRSDSYTGTGSTSTTPRRVADRITVLGEDQPSRR
jgi:hypothetical protein